MGGPLLYEIFNAPWMVLKYRSNVEAGVEDVDHHMNR